MDNIRLYKIEKQLEALAAESSDSPRMKMLFLALVEIENDHLDMSKSRIKLIS